MASKIRKQHPFALTFDKNVLNSISEPVFFLDKSLRIAWANNAALVDRTETSDNMVGRHCYEACFSKSAPCEGCPAIGTLSSAFPPTAAPQVFIAGGRLVTILYRVDPQGKIKGIVEIRHGSVNDKNSADNRSDRDRYHSVRADIWRAAADKTLAKEELIQRLLAILGRFLGASRASYYESDGDSSPLICKAHWGAAGMSSFLGENIPPELFREVSSVYENGLARIAHDDIPEPIRGPLGALFTSHGIRSLLLVLFDRATNSFFAFSDKNRERDWNEIETSLVLEMSGIVRMRLDQLKTEQEKSVLEDQLRHTQTLESIGQLAGGVAHDFNNVLGAISGYAEMIRQRFAQDNPKLEKYSSAILSSACKAAKLTSQLLAFARKGKFKKASMNLHETISRILLLLQHSLDEKTQVVLDLRAGNPAMVGDPTQVQDILLNLAMNSHDAMPEGGTIRISTENRDLDELVRKSHPRASHGPYVAVCVSDTGVGMDDATKARLFEPFFTTKESGQGYGLGLASVYGSVTSHNGYIGVKSEKGRGSAITVYFPVDANAAPAVHAEPVYKVARGTGTIVVVDNDESIRLICREMLTALGYTVREFETGTNALQHYRTHSVTEDLFIVDMIMEGMNGREFFRQLRKINPHTKAILSSGYSMSGELEEILSEGISGVLQKPFDTATLSRIVAKTLTDTGSPEPSAQ
jgi:signal transduction histidine kinase/CheY-like chemotaxis protein